METNIKDTNNIQNCNIFTHVKKTITKGRLVYMIATYIIMGLFAVVVVVPLLWALVSSFKTTADIMKYPFGFPAKLQWINYQNAWLAANMSKYFLNSLLITFGGIFLLVVLSVPCAYVLSRFKFFGSKFVNVYLMAGLFINVSYIVLPAFLMVNDIGKAILGNGAALTNNPFTVIIINAVSAVPFSVYLLSGFLMTLPRGFEEAAKIDGCSYMGTLIKIVIPLTLPSILTVILFNFLAFWNEYMVSYTFLTTDTFKPLSVGLLNIMQQAKISTDYGRMYAGLIIVMLPVLIVYCFVQKNLTKGMTVGGIKG